MPRYRTPAIALHWLVALAVATAFGLGWWVSGLPMSPARLKGINWHKWAGTTVLALTVLRLAWRATHRPPPPLPAPAWQLRAAAWAHGALYALTLAVPLLGWAYSSAAGFPVVWFGVLPLPDWVAPDRALAATLKPLHAAAAWTLAAGVLVHLAAVVQHQWLRREALLQRMWPFDSGET